MGSRLVVHVYVTTHLVLEAGSGVTRRDTETYTAFRWQKGEVHLTYYERGVQATRNTGKCLATAILSLLQEKQLLFWPLYVTD